MELEFLRRILVETSEDKFNEIISKAALKLSNERINTVSFVFWLCYMAENDLNDVIKSAWSLACEAAPTENPEADMLLMKEKGLDFEKLEYFKDKIVIQENVFGKTSFVKLLWKLNGLRNDISHNRIDSLIYNDEDLSLRATKEKLLMDYFCSIKSVDIDDSKLWSKFSKEQKDKIECIFDSKMK